MPQPRAPRVSAPVGRQPTVPAWIGVGANLGHPRLQISRALTWLDAHPDVALEAAAPMIQTAAVGPPQPDYLNTVARIRTALAPVALLDLLQSLEQAAGRVRAERWGPRTLDLDLLLYGLNGAATIATPRLVIPHPRMLERPFVMTPLAAIDPAIAQGITRS